MKDPTNAPTIVITGSTQGLGYGLARAFLERDCAVVLSGRTAEKVYAAVQALGADHDSRQIFGQACDVTHFDQVQGLWDAAMGRFGRVDIWISNAGIGQSPAPLWEHSAAHVRQVLETNLAGAMYCAMVVLPGMIRQGFGAYYNMEGLGSSGRRVAGLAAYGSSKAGLRYLTESLVEEARETPVLVGALSPGMVVTDLLMSPYDPESAEFARAQRIFNILADRVETVAPWLAQEVLANRKSGARISWLTRRRILTRFLLAPFRQRDVVSAGPA